MLLLFGFDFYIIENVTTLTIIGISDTDCYN